MILKKNEGGQTKWRRTGTASLAHGIFCTHAGRDQGIHQSPHIYSRPDYAIHYVQKGAGIFCGRPFQAGDGYLTTPMQTATITFNKGPMEIYWLSFQGERAKEWLEAVGIPDHNTVFSFSLTPKTIDLLKDFLESPPAQNEYAENCRLQAVLYSLMALHLERPAEEIPPIQNPARRVARFFEQNLDQAIELKSVAKQFYLSTGYLYTLFKKEYGVSPKEYLLSLRIRYAKRLLKEEPRLPIKSVAAAVGIENPLYFSRLFHERVGLSPKEYRNKS